VGEKRDGDAYVMWAEWLVNNENVIGKLTNAALK